MILSFSRIRPHAVHDTHDYWVVYHYLNKVSGETSMKITKVQKPRAALPRRSTHTSILTNIKLRLLLLKSILGLTKKKGGVNCIHKLDCPAKICLVAEKVVKDLEKAGRSATAKGCAITSRASPNPQLNGLLVAAE